MVLTIETLSDILRPLFPGPWGINANLDNETGCIVMTAPPLFSPDEMARREAAIVAMEACREEAKKNGIDKLSPEEIDALIHSH